MQPLPECKTLDKTEKTIQSLKNAKWFDLSNKFSDIDVRSKKYVLDYKGQLRRFCPSCGRPLRTWKSQLCRKCNMAIVGSNHLKTRKAKGLAP